MRSVLRYLTAALALLCLAEITDLAWLSAVRATITTTASNVVAAGNGSTTQWNFSFVGVSTADLIVSVTNSSGVTTVLTLNTQYSVTFTPQAPNSVWSVGGYVTYPLTGPPLALGSTLSIQRQVPNVQTTPFQNQGQFLPQAVETALDLLTMQVQQINTQLSDALVNPVISTPNIWSALQTYTAGITSTHSLSGSATLGNWNNFTVTSDTQGCHFCTDINSVWDYGGATQRGGRVNIFGWNIQTAPNSGVGQTTVGLGVEGIGQTNSGDGGGSGTEAGTYFGGNFIGACTLFVYECAGSEIDIRTDGAYRGHYTIGQSVVNVEAHQATGLDAAFAIYSGGLEPAAGGGGPWGPGMGFHYGLAFGELGMSGFVPIDSTGTLIGGYVESLSVLPVGYGFDGNLFSFANYFLRCCNLSNRFTVDGSGNATLGGATLNFTNGTNVNNQMTANSAGGIDVGTEIRILDNGLAGVKVGFGFISAAGTGYGNTLTGTLTWSGAGCSVNPVLNATSNSGGGIASYSVATAGVCAFQSFPGANATTWTRGGGLSAGTGFSVALDPVILNIFGCHHEDPSATCYASDAGQTGSFQLFNITTGGGMNWGPGSGATDTSLVRIGVGAMQLNGKLTLDTMTATAVAPTVSSGQIGYGSTTVAAGSGTCPTGTVGGSTVAGCIVVNIAGTARNVPFF